jgi:uncharacterized glyoxalase superfamily protein PhnB
VRFVNPIPFVRDIGISKTFYCEILGLAINDGKSLETTVWGLPSVISEPYGRQNILLYFEHDNLDALFERIAGNVNLIHPIETQAWGQRVFRFYDPDGHAIEIGEPLGNV